MDEGSQDYYIDLYPFTTGIDIDSGLDELDDVGAIRCRTG